MSGADFSSTAPIQMRMTVNSYVGNWGWSQIKSCFGFKTKEPKSRFSSFLCSNNLYQFVFHLSYFIMNLFPWIFITWYFSGANWESRNHCSPTVEWKYSTWKLCNERNLKECRLSNLWWSTDFRRRATTQFAETSTGEFLFETRGKYLKYKLFLSQQFTILSHLCCTCFFTTMMSD